MLRIARRARDDGGLALEQVLHRLDEQDVDAAGEQALDLRLVRVAEVGERDVAERRQLGAGADRADHEPGTLRRGVLLGDSARDAAPLLVQLAGRVGDAVLGEHHAERAEGRGLDRVHAGVEVLAVHPGDEVGP